MGSGIAGSIRRRSVSPSPGGDHTVVQPAALQRPGRFVKRRKRAALSQRMARFCVSLRNGAVRPPRSRHSAFPIVEEEQAFWIDCRTNSDTRTYAAQLDFAPAIRGRQDDLIPSTEGAMGSRTTYALIAFLCTATTASAQTANTLSGEGRHVAVPAGALTGVDTDGTGGAGAVLGFQVFEKDQNLMGVFFNFAGDKKITALSEILVRFS